MKHYFLILFFGATACLLSSCVTGEPKTIVEVVESDFAFVQAELTKDGTMRTLVGGKGRLEGKYQVGSFSKYICTIAVLAIENEGKLSLDDTISSLLPDYTGIEKDAVTIRHLLQNRSGIPERIIQAIQADSSLLETSIETLEAANTYAADKAIFPAGEQFDYTIGNWIVIQAILEKMGDSSLGQVLERRVFKPANADMSEVFTGAVKGKNAVTTEPKGISVPNFVGCAGGVASTPEDMLKIVRYAYKEADISQVGRAALTTIASDEDWYALGGRINKVEVFGEPRNLAWLSGSNGAFKSNLVYDPIDDIGFSIVTNENVQDEIRARRLDWVNSRIIIED